jgi:hypothetical protein
MLVNEDLLSQIADSSEVSTPRSDDYVHLRGVTILRANDLYAVEPIYISTEGAVDISMSGKLVKSPLRGHGVVLHFYNEDGQKWEQIFQFHKGKTYTVTTEPKTDTEFFSKGV